MASVLTPTSVSQNDTVHWYLSPVRDLKVCMGSKSWFMVLFLELLVGLHFGVVFGVVELV